MSRRMRIGQGFDVHTFGNGDHVVLGGVRIAHDRGVIAHSDGDVVIHALCDALLGAIGMGDIGRQFPDTDPRYRGADSRLFLRTVAALVREAGFGLVNADLTVLEQLQQDFPQDGIGSLRSLAGAFQFSGDDVDKKIRALSGGEKSRLAIARMLFNPPNFLVLDEPTNHLDLATKEMLVDALKDFEGTMIFVSHDRMFLRGLGSRVLELGGESGTDRNPTVYPGSYVEYVQKLGHEAPGIYS